MADQGLLVLEGVGMLYPNLEGKEQRYNVKGSRNFCAVVNEQQAEIVRAWNGNLKETEVREEGDVPLLYLPVAVGFEYKPPVIFAISSKGRSLLTERNVHVLDSLDFSTIDIVCRPRTYDPAQSGGTGTKAYLKSGFFTIDEDPLMAKYGIDFGASEDEEA